MPFIKTSVIKTEYQHVDFDPDAPTIGQQIDMILADAASNPSESRIHELTFGFETDDDFHQYMRKFHDQLHGVRDVKGVNLRKRARPADDGYAMPAD